MKLRNSNCRFLLLGLLLLSSCAVANQRFAMQQDTFARNYSRIKEIVVEEAANNGFKEITSEIKPNANNGWNGQLFFQLKTANGTDQLFVKFEPTGNDISVYVHGAGSRTNPKGAATAIEARLKQENFIKKISNNQDAKEKETQTPSQTPSTNLNSPINYLISIKRANIRLENNTKSRIITTLNSGEKLEQIDKANNWFKVKTTEGIIGWVSKSLVENYK